MKRDVLIYADKERRLRFNTTAFCTLEEITGKTVFELNEGAGMREMRAMLYCGLYWEDKELTIEGTGEVMDVILREKDVDYLSEKLGEALELAIGDKETKEKKPMNRKERRRSR